MLCNQNSHLEHGERPTGIAQNFVAFAIEAEVFYISDPFCRLKFSCYILNGIEQLVIESFDKI